MDFATLAVIGIFVIAVFLLVLFLWPGSESTLEDGDYQDYDYHQFDDGEYEEYPVPLGPTEYEELEFSDETEEILDSDYDCLPEIPVDENYETSEFDSTDELFQKEREKYV